MRVVREIMGDLALTGLSPDQMALVMELSASLAAEARPVGDQQAERRRAADRQRKRISRPQKSAETAETAEHLPPYEVSSTPQPDTPIEANASIAPKPDRAKPKRRLPEGWAPEPLGSNTVSADTVSAWEPGAIERELSKFRDHHTAAGTLSADWQASWRKWIGNAEHFGAQRNGRTPSDRRAYPVAGPRPDSTLALLQAANAAIAAGG